jgi:hypothetical protein
MPPIQVWLLRPHYNQPEESGWYPQARSCLLTGRISAEGCIKRSSLVRTKLANPRFGTLGVPLVTNGATCLETGFPSKATQYTRSFLNFQGKSLSSTGKQPRYREITGFYPPWPGMHWQPIGIRQEMTPMPSLFSGTSCNQTSCQCEATIFDLHFPKPRKM